MALDLSTHSEQSLKAVKKTPGLVIVFDGISTILTNVAASSVIQFGDPGLEFGGGCAFGQIKEDSDQIQAVSFDSSAGGTTTKIKEKVDPQKGLGESVSSMDFAIIDNKAGDVINLFGSYEFLGRKTIFYVTPNNIGSTWPNDYEPVFRGIIDQVNFQNEAKAISMTVSHPDQKKRQAIFVENKNELAASANSSETTITVGDTAKASTLLQPITGPDGTQDSSFTGYLVVEDEVIEYGSASGATISGLTRGSLATIAAAHGENEAVESLYRLKGNVLDIALKIMLSGWAGPFKSGVEIGSFTASNTILFPSYNLVDRHGLTIGDYITTTGANNSENNVSLKLINDISVSANGTTTLTISDVTFVDEASSPASAAFRSKYDTLPDGLKMSPDEVDVERHETIRDTFLSSTSDIDIYLKETIEDAKDWIAEQLYVPLALHSVPRKTRASVAYEAPPFAFEIGDLTTLSTNNVVSPSRIRKRRSLGKNFYNTIIYKYDESPIEDKFLKGEITVDGASLNKIDFPIKAFKIEAKALRNLNDINRATDKRLNRYRFAAATLNQMQVTFEAGFPIELSDIVIVNESALKIADELNGAKTGDTEKLYQVVGKEWDISNGKIILTLLNTGYNIDNRFAAIGPASNVASVTNASTFTIEESFQSSDFFTDEWKKWESWGGQVVRLRSSDYASAATGTLKTPSSNTINLESSLSITPSAGWVMEFSDYDQMSSSVKIRYASVTSGSADFGDGGKAYLMI